MRDQQISQRNLYNYIDTNGFDGLDLDWEYPAQRGGIESDKEMFVTLVKELKSAFEPKGYILTSAVAVTQTHIDLSYDVPALTQYLDYLNLMLYDFHGTWDTETGVNAPLYPQLTDDASLNLNGNHSVHVWLENGANASKLLMGLGGYGKSFTLTSLNNTSTDQKNNSSEWSITEVTGNYVYANKDLLWVGYDNPSTIYVKAQYAKTMGLRGIMYWAVDLDDFQGLCGDKFPLITQGIAGYNSV
ncbi:hypothetical protein MSG28_009287 [Choristoneura fumiferana]|uniref:Uncharacterized protein n=1 Tax=Choristoneura fumiferana TaxID=7141 RepID=A0ACC0KXD0_CHOFU|nr:hypothetical protein MSG28_009287 [Choristoneura fumiferana]